MKGYTTVSIPKGLHDAVKKLIEENPGLGYRSVAELCKDGLRTKMLEIRREIKEL